MDEIKNIRLSKSCIGIAERQAVEDVLQREYLGMGKDVERFEIALSEYLGRPVACVTNGTAALHLALQACDIGLGDEVLVPSLTYLASFQAISATGAHPVACDVNETTLCIDPEDMGRRINEKTRAVMPMHYAGGPCNLEKIYDLAEQYGIRVVEDAAHAFGTVYQGRRIGGFGDIACFSFDGIKNITSGEGGCVVTDDPLVLRKVQDARLLGVNRDTEKRYIGKRSWEFDVNAQGWRYHMSNIMAAIGIVQLAKFPEVIVKRRAIANRYSQCFSATTSVIPVLSNFDEIVPHIYVVRIAGLQNRSDLRRELAELGIETGVHYLPNHRLSYYQDCTASELHITERIYPTLLTLPLHPDLSENDVDYVSNNLLHLLPDYIAA